MGDITRTLFGGSKSSSKSVPVDMTPASLRSLRTPLSDALRQMISGDPSTVFSVPQSPAAQSGEMVAPLTPTEQAMLLQLRNEGGARQGLIDQVFSGNFLPGQEGANPFLEAAIESAQRPTLEGLEETLSRVLPGRFTQAGQFVQPQGSSAFDRAVAIASRGAANAMADIATNLSFGVHEAERGRQMQAIQLGQAEVDTTLKKLNAQALPRLIEDLGIERGLQEFNVRTQALLEMLRIMAGASSPTIANVSTASGTSQKGVIPGVASLFPKGV